MIRPWAGELSKPNRRGRAVAVMALFVAAVTTLRAQTFTTVLNFDGANGVYPYAPLVQDTDGSLFGTTSNEGLAT
jgi:hypothetical protein